MRSVRQNEGFSLLELLISLVILLTVSGSAFEVLSYYQKAYLSTEMRADVHSGIRAALALMDCSSTTTKKRLIQIAWNNSRRCPPPRNKPRASSLQATCVDYSAAETPACPAGRGACAPIRRCASAKYASSISKPMNLGIPQLLAATAEFPIPRNGSSIV